MTAAARPESDRPMIICPVLGALVHSGRLQLDEAGRVGFEATRRALLGIGLSRPLAGMLVALAPLSNDIREARHNWRSRSFNPERMVGSVADHAGDTGIIGKGWFDPDRFASMLAMSTDGESLSVREMAAVIAVDQQRRPGLLSFMSLIELGALMEVFGYTDRQGKRRISFATLRGFYCAGSLPDGWEPRAKVGVLRTLASVWRLFRALPDAPVVWLREI